MLDEPRSEEHESTEDVSLPSTRRPARWKQFLPGPGPVLALLIVCSIACRVIWLALPARSLIFDEAYYVNAARIVLGTHLAPGTTYAGQPAGKDPNREHPPLGKVLIAGSMRVFGDDALGWRFPSLVAGIASIVLIYGIVLAAGGDPWLGILSATVFSFDNLALVHSRIGTLDMMLLGFLLLGAWLALRKQPVLAGMACAVACLVKLTGIYGFVALVLFETLEMLRIRRQTGKWAAPQARAIGLLIIGFVPLWFVGLWLLDIKFTLFTNPIDHLRYMLKYGFALTRSGGPQGQESYPWQWLLNDVQMTYLRTDQQILTNHHVVATRALVYFRGAMNPLIIGALPFGVGYTLWRAWCVGDRLALWAIIWFAANFLPYLPLSMAEHRISYIYYILPALPAVAVGIAQFLRQGGLPRVVQWVYLLMVLVGFIGYFPFRVVPH